MASKIEKKDRKRLQREVEQKHRSVEEAAMPISRKDLSALFGFLDERLGKEPCQHNLKYTLDFLAKRRLSEDEIVRWLGEYGGFCDCEVLANVAEHWEK
jgi:Protein of unknown function (DUF2695)